MTTAIGNERINYNAMGRKRGLIIGRTYSGVLCAYDLLCPNCDFNSELKWADAPQELRCNKCKRVYSIYSDWNNTSASAIIPKEVSYRYRIRENILKNLVIPINSRTFAPAKQLPRWWNGRHEGLKIP